MLKLSELKELEAEHKVLMEEFTTLKEKVNAVQYSDTVFVIGNGALEFVKFIRSLEDKITKFEKIKAANGGRF